MGCAHIMLINKAIRNGTSIAFAKIIPAMIIINAAIFSTVNDDSSGNILFMAKIVESFSFKSVSFIVFLNFSVADASLRALP